MQAFRSRRVIVAVFCTFVFCSTASYAQTFPADTGTGSTSANPANPAAPVDVVHSGTTVIDFGQSPVLNISGDFTNFGTVYAISTNPLVTTATISAQNIVNQPGAVITTVLPVQGLPGVTNALTGLNLVINSIANIINYGTISSAGSLTVTVGGAIHNLAGLSGVSPVMSAMQNLNLQASSIVNQGAILAGGNMGVQSTVLANQTQATMSSLQNMVLQTGGVLNNGSIVSRLGKTATGKHSACVLYGQILAVQTSY